MGAIMFGITSVVWMAMGVLLAVGPQLWTRWISRLLDDDWKRFWMTQAMIFMGLILMAGSSEFRGFWVWVSCGVLLILKGCILLGAGRELRQALFAWTREWPLWIYRCSGIVMVVLAVFLATDALMNP